MRQQMKRIVDLESLQLKLAEFSDADILAIGRQSYSDIFLQNARFGFHSLHDGGRVVFKAGRFKHAFFLAENWQTSKEKTRIDIRRVERLRWILPMLRCEAPNAECWLVPDDGVEKRIYVCFGLGYVIWLEPGNAQGDWSFSTAYTTSSRQIREYIKGGKRIYPNNKNRP